MNIYTKTCKSDLIDFCIFRWTGERKKELREGYDVRASFAYLNLLTDHIAVTPVPLLLRLVVLRRFTSAFKSSH